MDEQSFRGMLYAFTLTLIHQFMEKGRLMKCLSVWQPWADLIVRGRKNIENRHWETPYRGLLLTHAGLTFAEDHGLDERRLPDADHWIVEASKERLGVLVGTAELADCVATHPSPWFYGPFGFVLTEPKLFRQPISWPGGRRLFDIPDVEARALIPSLE